MLVRNSRRFVHMLAAVAVLSGCEGVVSGDEELVLVEPPADPGTFRLLNWIAPLGEEALPTQAKAGSGLLVRLDEGALAASRLEIATRDGESLVALRRHVLQTALGGHSWVGEFEGSPGSLLTITVRDGTVAGFATLARRSFEFATSREGELRMFEVDEAKLPTLENEAPVPADLSGDALAASSGPTAASDGTVIDLMVVYTPATAAAYGRATIESQIQSAVAAANQAYRNSLVPVSLNLVYLGEVAYAESGDGHVDLRALQSPSDGLMDEVHRLRTDHGADLVSLIVNNAAGLCGTGYLMSPESAGFAPYAFNIVVAGCLSGHTLTHELGHNMGSHHDRANAGGAGAAPYSYGYRNCASDGTGFRTVMSYSCTGAPRVAYLSNPNVLYNGLPTGISYEADPANSADNARSVTQTSDTVSSFRAGAPTAPPAAPDSLSARAISDTRIDLVWADRSSDESGFQVERSLDGASWSEIASVGANVTSYANTGLSASTSYSYRVRGFNGVGSSAYSAVALATTLAPPAAPPAAPGSVSATSNSAGVVSLSWADLSSDEDGFEIGRQKLGRSGNWGTLQVVAKVTRDVATYQDSVGGGTYRYFVRAFNGGGSSSWAGPAELFVARLPKGKQ